jgi:hypothetical protein
LTVGGSDEAVVFVSDSNRKDPSAIGAPGQGMSPGNETAKELAKKLCGKAVVSCTSQRSSLILNPFRLRIQLRKWRRLIRRGDRIRGSKEAVAPIIPLDALFVVVKPLIWIPVDV